MPRRHASRQDFGWSSKSRKAIHGMILCVMGALIGQACEIFKRNNLRQMEVGDRVLFYHSSTGKCVVGIAAVAKAAYPDPTADDPRWVAVDLKPLKPLKTEVPLASIRSNPKLSNLPLIRQSQLSVMAVTKEDFETIVEMGTGKN